MRITDDPGRCVGEADGAVEDAFRWPAGNDVAGDLRLLAERTGLLLGRWPGQLRGVGVAMPATCDAAGVVRVWPGRPNWAGTDLVAFLGRLFPGTATTFADDGDLAALAEAREARCESLLYLGVGTGIGGGIVHNGRPWPGPTRGSCEIGHLIVDKGGSPCDCGRSGCVQAMASGPATLRRAARLAGRHVRFAELADAVRAGDAWALAAIDESAAALAAAVIGICELAHPDAVVLGGGFAARIPAIVDAVRDHVAQSVRPGSDPVVIRPAMLGARSSLQGAILLARLSR